MGKSIFSIFKPDFLPVFAALRSTAVLARFFGPKFVKKFLMNFFREYYAELSEKYYYRHITRNLRAKFNGLWKYHYKSDLKSQ